MTHHAPSTLTTPTTGTAGAWAALADRFAPDCHADPVEFYGPNGTFVPAVAPRGPVPPTLVAALRKLGWRESHEIIRGGSVATRVLVWRMPGC